MRFKNREANVEDLEHFSSRRAGIPVIRLIRGRRDVPRGGHRRGKASWMVNTATNNQCQVSSVCAYVEIQGAVRSAATG